MTVQEAQEMVGLQVLMFFLVTFLGIVKEGVFATAARMLWV